MEEFKKRLQFQNSGLQIQTLWRLKSEVMRRRSLAQAVDVKNQEPPELLLFLDCLCGSDVLLSELSGQVLLQLVEEDALELGLALNSVLNHVPSAKSLSGVVKAVCGLTTLQALAMRTRETVYRCPYSLRSPCHPLISVLTNRPEAWSDILDGVHTIFSHSDTRVREVALELTRPFITFLLVEPQQSDQYSLARAGLVRRLTVLTIGQHEQSMALAGLLLKIIPGMQSETRKDVELLADVTTTSLSLAGHPLSSLLDQNGQYRRGEADPPLWLQLAGQLWSLGLEVLLLSLRLNLVPGGLVRELTRLAACGGQETANMDLLLLAEVLGSSLVFPQSGLIELAQEFVSHLATAPTAACLAALIPPLLQVLALPQGNLMSRLNRPSLGVRETAGQLLMVVQDRLASLGVTDIEGVQPAITPCISSQGYKLRLLQALLLHMKLDQTFHNSPVIWLQNLSSAIDRPESCSSHLTNLVSGLLFTSQTPTLTKAAACVLVKVAQTDHKQALDILPLILYSLRRADNPESKLILLECVPQLATHKFCVAPILKIIQALGRSDQLKAMSVRLMVILWRQQDRCFPQLLQTITEQFRSTSPLDDRLSTDVLLAKAAAILEVCKLKPEHHGADILAALSEVLNMADGEKNTAAAVLALQGLRRLCQAEVIDLISVWSVLGSKLRLEARPLVVVEVCRLLSLVPSLAVDTDQYQALLQDTVQNLWLYAASSNCLVQAAAFSALSEFDSANFSVSHLPRQVTEELYCQADRVMSQQEPEGDTQPLEVVVAEMFPLVPGQCFMQLVAEQTDPGVLAAGQSLLHALVAKEVVNLPRGLYYSSLRRQGMAANQGKAVETIPKFLLQQFEKCKQPGLLPGLAAGLLFCYDPPLEVARDGRPRKHYIIKHGRTFLSMFATLLTEVPVQPSEWQRSALLPQAWNSFMERLFLSLLEGHKVEIDLQNQHGQEASSATEDLKQTVWLKVRDSIMDVIKTASVGTPAAQANSILALAGLTLCVHKFVSDLAPEALRAASLLTQYMSHSHWLTVTMDTIWSLVDLSYKPKAEIHGLCLQKSGSDRAPASSLCSGVARLAASQLVSVYMAVDLDRIPLLLSSFTEALPTGAKALELPSLSYYNGLSLGMLLARLFEEHYSEMTGSKGMLIVWKSLTALEEASLATGQENKTGCLLGLSLALCAMCGEGKTESRVHVTSLLDKLQACWSNTGLTDSSYQPMAVAVSSVVATLYACNATGEEQVMWLVDRLQQLHTENPQLTGVSLALGLVLFSVHKVGLRSVQSSRQTLAQQWLQQVASQETSPVDKVSKLTGLLALVGSVQTLIAVQGSSLVTGSDVDVSKIIATVSQVVVDQSEPGLQCVAAWMLGHLHLSACAVAEQRSSVPASYSYLPESSVLRAVVDFLLEASRLGPESSGLSCVSAALESLKVTGVLPPLNWAGLISPFMRQNFGETIKVLCLRIGVSQMGSSASAAMFVSSWLSPALFSSLLPESQAVLQTSLPIIIKSCPHSCLKQFLEHCCLTSTADQCPLLEGLSGALQVDDPPPAVTLLLYQVTGQLYHLLPAQASISVLQLMSECLAQLPDEVLDSVIASDFADSTTQLKGCFIRCQLVASGKQPLSLLNYMVDASFNTDYWDHRLGMLFLTHCLAGVSRTEGQVCQLGARQQWLIELLGHTHSLVTGAMPLAPTAPDMDKVITYVTNVVTCAVTTLTWPLQADLCVLGLSPKIFKSGTPKNTRHTQTDGRQNDLDKTQAEGSHQDTELVPGQETLLADFTQQLPAVVQVLAQKPWDVVLPKMVDWLMTLVQLKETGFRDKQILTEALMTLRHSPVMKQAAVWTKLISLVI